MMLILAMLLSFARANTQIMLNSPDSSQLVGKKVAAVTLVNEKGTMLELGKTSAPVVLLPFYAHCTSACPLNINHLKEVTKELGSFKLLVILVTFNPEDEKEDLKELKKNMHLPPDWFIGKVEENRTVELMESIGFRYMKQDKEFAHPNVVVLISQEGIIKKFIYGTSFKKENLKLD